MGKKRKKLASKKKLIELWYIYRQDIPIYISQGGRHCKCIEFEFLLYISSSNELSFHLRDINRKDVAFLRSAIDIYSCTYISQRHDKRNMKNALKCKKKKYKRDK